MRIVAYVRVSTETQADHGLGLDVQREAIKAWAGEHGHRVVAWCADEGVSGAKDLEDRDGLAEAIGMLGWHAGHRRADGLVVYKLDRLARDLIIQEQMLADIWRLDAVVCSTSASEQEHLRDDPDDPSRTMIRQILGAVSQYERAMIAMRLRSGRKRKAADGGYAFGAPPFGHQAVDRELVAHDSEQQVVARMRRLRSGGRSYREIAAQLNEEGVSAKRGGEWHPMTVRRVLQRSDAA